MGYDRKLIHQPSLYCQPKRGRLPDARVQDPRKLGPILQGSIAFTRAIDEAAANMVALWKVLESQGIAVQGVGRQAYRT